MVFYDFEVFAYDWLVVFIDPINEVKTVVVNDSDKLTSVYEKNKSTIWVGFNNKHYDQYIMKSIMLGMNPKDVNDWIIVKKREGWQYSREFSRIPMINYDCMPNPPVSLKTMEAFMLSDIKETDVPFNIQRKLTPQEIATTIKYCTHDVEQTINVFMEKIDDFEAIRAIIEAFPDQLTLSDIGSSEARITAKVLQCTRHDYNDEFNFEIEPCVKLEKYHVVQEWFENLYDNFVEKWGIPDDEHTMPSLKQSKKRVTTRQGFYQQELTIDVAGVPHTFGFGGVHGAAEHPVHNSEADGAGFHVDVNNYYPSYLIAHHRVTRSAGNDNYRGVYLTRKRMKMKQLAAKTKAEAKGWKVKQLPYKKMLNALSGAMKDKTNPAYDPKMNNTMCINGQLMLLDLIEHLERDLPGFQLIQSNTDGLIVWIPNTDEAFNLLDDICYDWECRMSTPDCDIALALDSISEIYQKDVNNYLWIDTDGGVERIGAYVKELSPLDNDFPILNKALVDYMTKGISPERTIMDCNELWQFQKVVKVSKLYKEAGHEFGQHTVKHHRKKDGTPGEDEYFYKSLERYTYKCFRVFASKDMNDGRFVKIKDTEAGEKIEKFGSTPNHCFLFNDDIKGVPVPEKLDRQWYLDIALSRLRDYGIEVKNHDR